MASPLTSSRPILVGTNHRDYNSIRNFSGLSSAAFRFKKTYDILTLPGYFVGKVPIKMPDYLRRVFRTLHCDFSLFGVDVMHLFNAVSVSRTPWVVTFEHAVPLWNLRSHLGFRLLAGRSCRKLIAMSQCAYDIESHYLARFPELEDRVRNKTVILHPPQDANIGDFGEKPRSRGAIRMTMVGHLFYLKGGKEILLALDRLVRDGASVKVNVVSLMHRDTYAAQPTNEDVQLVRELLGRHKARIQHYPQLANRQVIDLYRDSDIGLLPSYAETYGYSVLEAQSCGCPVVTTNIRALPEINNNEVGWVIEVPKDELGNARLAGAAEREAFSRLLQEALYSVIKGICNSPVEIEIKGKKALQRIREHHDPARAARKLEQIYREALG